MAAGTRQNHGIQKKQWPTDGNPTASSPLAKFLHDLGVDRIDIRGGDTAPGVGEAPPGPEARDLDVRQDRPSARVFSGFYSPEI